MKTKMSFIFLIILLSSCKKTKREYDYDNIDFKEEMRQFVIEISGYSKNLKSDFIIIPQNGVELVTNDGNENSNLHNNYIDAIDAQGQEELNFGYNADNLETPLDIHNHLKHFLDLEKNSGKPILITDYVTSQINIERSYIKNEFLDYLSFQAENRELNIIPSFIHNENSNNITSISNAENFLYLINYNNFSSKQDLINSIQQTNYDIIILDLFFNQAELTSQDLNRLKHKQNGGLRKLIAYISIGEAEDYRYYWKSEWNNDAPVWLEAENQYWEGNYKVKYWENDWKKIIFGNNQSYIKKIIDAGFDGAYMDIIDAYDYFEDKYNTRN